MKRSFFAIAILPWLLFACGNRNTIADRTLDASREMTLSEPVPAVEEPEPNTEGYAAIQENSFVTALHQPLSTFSVDVDKASYSNMRRFLNNGRLPPAGAVRIEEMINYFDYDYKKPEDGKPFSVVTEVAGCPWNESHKLVHIGLKGREIEQTGLPPSNLVFLVDVSGSMEAEDKLPLLKRSLLLLVDKLSDEDRVSIVAYAGNAGLVLPSTSGAEKSTIREAIENLEAGGSTAGGAGIVLAYKEARKHFMQQGNNRIIIATDGDFNVGLSSEDELVRLVEKERESGVFLSVLGLGTGNYQDSKMQQLADKGNGNHYYIDGIAEARKVLVKEFSGTLFTIAKDVKIQVEFNPAKVQAYRLIGYENRMLNKEDFNDDKKDAGEIGSGHTVTALYEIIPAGVTDDLVKSVDELKYQDEPGETKATDHSGELLTIKLRYKAPQSDVSEKIIVPVMDGNESWKSTSDNFRFSAAVAEFGLLLRNSEYKQKASYTQVLAIAKGATGDDENGYRSEFGTLVTKASDLAKADKE
ncbi:vWA domain-containing protein [Taibaiella koreensis]|uniref:vWA domain-containing protein n=1 Tax=Taibaiella koreensis TaxID=1268548 RepID=UPI000E599EC7|nr:von Willebrand factor type A domain-containing protein [Taibaiella koreensis]